MPDNAGRPRLRLPHFLWAGGKNPGLPSRLTDEQLMILGLLLVVLLAVSMLYCLGFASLAVREVWQQAPQPLNGTATAEAPLVEPPSADRQVGTASP
jgi:hypothetical protein